MAKKRRCIVIDDKEWRAAADAAARESRSVSNWIRMAIAAALTR